MRILITYDIADTRQRTKVATLLEGYGVRVNYSVFELEITSARLGTLLHAIREHCDEKIDSVRVYRFSSETAAKSFELLGRMQPFERVSAYVD